MKFDRVILVVDADVSSYKGILRMAERLAAEVVHFACSSELNRWAGDKRLRFGPANLALCVVFDPEFLDVFERKPGRRCFRPMAAYLYQPGRKHVQSTAGDQLRRFRFYREAVSAGPDAVGLRTGVGYLRTRYPAAQRIQDADPQRIADVRDGGQRPDQPGNFRTIDISIKTVKVHRANLMRKVRAKSVTELLRGYDEFKASGNGAHGAAKSFPPTHEAAPISIRACRIPSQTLRHPGLNPTANRIHHPWN